MALGSGVSAWRTMSAHAVLLLGLACPAAAQPNVETPQSPRAQTRDPLGRDTPRGTITGLGLAAHRQDASAERYLQITPAGRPAAGQLARDLTELIERYYLAPLTALSNDPEGITTDGLPLDRERVALTIDESPVEIELVRVKDRESGLIWLVSSQTVAQIPRIRDSAGSTWVERLVPASLIGETIFGVSAPRLVGWAITLLVPFTVLWLGSMLLMASARWTLTNPARRRLIDSWYAETRWLTVVLLTLAVHGGLIRLLGFSLQFRLTYIRTLVVAAVISGTWLSWRVMTLSFSEARRVAARGGHVSLQSLLMLAERVCKTVLVLLSIFALLTIGGVDTATALAGVGLGGVAVALGAQKSVENLLGGVFLVTDRAIAVGDFCTISDRQGVVEDITMRSVRLRTVEQTLLSVPTGVLSQSTLENFATRHKIVMKTTLRLRYGTTTEQLRRVLRGVQTLLDGRSDIEADTARIRLVDFGVRAIELELFAYVLTSDWLKFLTVREDVLLHIAAIVESSAIGFSQPVVLDDDAIHVNVSVQTRDVAPDEPATRTRR
jgi:MscS family membrane protein